MRGSSGSSDRPSAIPRFYYRVMSICKPRCAIDVCTQHTKHYVWSSYLKWSNTMERKCSAKNLNERLPKCSFCVLIVFSKFAQNHHGLADHTTHWWFSIVCLVIQVHYWLRQDYYLVLVPINQHYVDNSRYRLLKYLLVKYEIWRSFVAWELYPFPGSHSWKK